MAMDGAAEKGYIDIVKFLYEHRQSQACSQYIITYACFNENIELLYYLAHTVTNVRCHPKDLTLNLIEDDGEDEVAHQIPNNNIKQKKTKSKIYQFISRKWNQLKKKRLK
ncbi:hypothetical protein DFA_04363 [Cavenderia fasciculata]|uniref:Ankyrin repeat-containing protein n=1 Tax=Cavenderia fasciculata TaxID=261658 RepID=F4PPD2_CACFS|nr:uncharacterized protein DFA_04363 [Cavenderia fasciculata]EGG22245.1 hypothetical protein DFA_04363 [Cavenderia fasciculata]|eukprot:XP_004360096.1 hypothetical protein DFA_04363 [Cavenderia fasciculata]